MLPTMLLISKCMCFFFYYFSYFDFFIKAVEPFVLVFVANWLERMVLLHRYLPDSVEDNHKNS
jgi:hypothetical protein